MIGKLMPRRCETLVLAHTGTVSWLLSSESSRLHFQDDFQFDRRTEWKAGDTKDKARRDGLFAEDVSKQLGGGVGDLGVLGELGRCGDVDAEPDDVADAVEGT